MDIVLMSSWLGYGKNRVYLHINRKAQCSHYGKGGQILHEIKPLYGAAIPAWTHNEIFEIKVSKRCLDFCVDLTLYKIPNKRKIVSDEKYNSLLNT